MSSIDLRMGLIKAIVFSNALREYDAEEDQDPDTEPKPPLPKMLVYATRTALVLQIVSILDEGLSDYIQAQHPTAKCDRLKNRIEFLKARGLLKYPDRAQALAVRRNELAHEPEKYADWNDWHRAFICAKIELEHLAVIEPLEEPR